MSTRCNHDLIAYYLPTEKYNFTPEQLKLIEDNHDYVFVWLERHCLDARDYYDVVIFGFLEGIKKYDKTRPDANLKGVLYYEMKKHLRGHLQFINRLSQRASNNCFPLQLLNEDHKIYSYYDVDHNFNLAEIVEQDLLLEEFLSDNSLSDEEKVYCRLFAQGHSALDIAIMIEKSYQSLLLQDFAISDLLIKLYRKRHLMGRNIKNMRKKIERIHSLYYA